MGESSGLCQRCRAEVPDGERCPVCGLDQTSAAGGEANQSIADWFIGRIVEGYQIESVLGSSARGAVFVGRPAHQPSGSTAVAVKIVTHDRSRSKMQDRLLTLAASAIGIQHVSLASLLSANVDLGLGAAYLVSELAPGADLQKRLDSEGALPSSLVAKVGRSIALALATLHDKGALHRDIRPAHIVQDELGAARLVELGFPPVVSFSSGHGETAHAPISGTPQYAAPEQAREPENPGIASDVYALGGTLFHLLTGRPPFVAESPVGLLVQHASRPAPSVKSLVPLAPERLAQLIDRMLAKDPAHRPTAAHVAAEIERPSASRSTASVAPMPETGAQMFPLCRSWLRRDSSLAAYLVERDVVGTEDLDEALTVQASADSNKRSLAETLLERGLAARDALADAERAVAGSDKRREDATFGRLAMEEGFVKKGEMERALSETGDAWISVSRSLVKRQIMSSDTAGMVTASVARHLREIDTVPVERVAQRLGVSAEAIAAARQALTSMPPDDDSSLVNCLLDAGAIDQELAAGIKVEMIRAHLPGSHSQ